MAPAHGSLAIPSKTLEHLVGISSDVVAYWYHCTVNIRYACAVTQSIHLEEKHKFEKHTALKFHKPVVGNCAWKIVTKMETDFV
jgi:hypothetical protein